MHRKMLVSYFLLQMSEDTVRVAVRIRPLVTTEIEKGCQTCLDVVNGEPQIIIRNTDKAFTYNYVFPPEVGQEQFYDTAVKEMIQNIFQGKIVFKRNSYSFVRNSIIGFVRLCFTVLLFLFSSKLLICNNSY